MHIRILLLVCLLSCMWGLSFGQDLKLISGEIYEIRAGSNKNDILTRTDGKVNRYWQSPNRRFVAYEKIKRYVDEHSDIEDDPDIRQVPVCDILILDVSARRDVGEIHAQNDIDIFMKVDKWVSEDDLLLHDADGVAVSSYYIYNIKSKELIQIEWEEYDKLR